MWAAAIVVTTPTVGWQSAASAAISPRAFVPSSSTARLVLGPEAQQRQRQPPLVVEAAARA